VEDACVATPRRNVRTVQTQTASEDSLQLFF
jgi:hypothetical protein